MSALNVTPRDDYDKLGQEVLIELPDPKIITDDCTIIMNGHHNYSAREEDRQVSEESKPFLNHTPSFQAAESSTKPFPLKESFIASSLEEDSDPELEPESSTHLLQDLELNRQSPNCTKIKGKLPSFRSPSKKQASNISHSHVQHRPLGQSTIPNSICQVAKKYWTCTPFIWIFLCITTVVISFCTALAMYLATATKCDPPKQWWQRATFYEIFPSSFQDSDSDGFGDMKGLTQRLSYIQSLGVDAVRLNSIFSALDYPLEYEHVIDFANIDPHLGRIEDFQEFVKELHSRGMRLILDINPTVTSDQHTWAAHWLLHRKGPFEHFYVNITDEEEEEPRLEPNPDYSDSSWTSSHRTFGNHIYLNWSNPILQREMKQILQTWTAQGIDGFYFKHLDNLQVEEREHIAQIIGQWREILDAHNNSRKVLMVSQSDIEYLELVLDPVTFTSIPAMVDLIDAGICIRKPNSSEVHVAEEVNRARKFWSQFVFPPTLVWRLGTVETMRLASKIGSEMNLAGLFLLAILPGSFSVFYGDEIGLKDTFDQSTRKEYRGGQLVPMPWTAEKMANFTSASGRAWLPLHPEWIVVNVESQVDKLDLFKKLTEFKRSSQTWLPTIKRPSLPQVFYLFNMPQEEEPPRYRIYQNHCGLVAVDILDNAGIFFANFGWESVQLLTSKCDDRMSLESFIHFETFESKLATNSSLVGRVEWRKIMLKPGDSAVGPIYN